MSAAGVTTSVHFRPLHQFSWFAGNAPVGRTGLAVCDTLEPRTLSLPLHVNLTDTDVDRVCDVFLDALGSSGASGSPGASGSSAAARATASEAST